MKNIIKDKRAGIAYNIAVLLMGMFLCGIIVQSCSSNVEESFFGNSDSKFTLFEKEFSNNLSSDKNVVKLIGFKTYNINEEEKADFIHLVAEFGEEMRKINNIVANDYSFFRIYFPLHTAIVEYEGKAYTADEKGLVHIPNLRNISKVAVIGRKKSETVYGTGSNIIEKDRILLKRSFRQKTEEGVQMGYSIEGNACIFDLNALAGMDESCCKKTLCNVPRLKSGSEPDESGEGGNVSCFQNHGGKTCSEAFSIHGGRCVYVHGVCMDYNGPFGNCRNGNIIDFIGSDCDYAMGSGHCWNELM